jgi:hypothetical protein
MRPWLPPPVLTLLILCTAPLLAADPVPFGGWTLAAAPDLRQVIAAATAPLNFLVRPIARSRLAKTNEAYRTLTLVRGERTFSVQFDQRPALVMPADGSAVAWTREDGETFRIAARMEQDALVQTFQAADGTRTNVFRPDPATGGLSLAVRITSPRLPAPLVYTLDYRVGTRILTPAGSAAARGIP